MVSLSQRELEMEAELAELARRHPLSPRSWHYEVQRRLVRTGWASEDVVLALRQERNLVPPGPVTVASLLGCEKRYLALFDPDESSGPTDRRPARATAG